MGDILVFTTVDGAKLVESAGSIATLDHWWRTRMTAQGIGCPTRTLDALDLQWSDAQRSRFMAQRWPETEYSTTNLAL